MTANTCKHCGVPIEFVSLWGGPKHWEHKVIHKLFWPDYYRICRLEAEPDDGGEAT